MGQLLVGAAVRDLLRDTDVSLARERLRVRARLLVQFRLAPWWQSRWCTVAGMDITPFTGTELLTAIFGTDQRGCDCPSHLNCIHEPITDTGEPNPIYRG
jgi:hypothetical protein